MEGKALLYSLSRYNFFGGFIYFFRDTQKLSPFYKTENYTGTGNSKRFNLFPYKTFPTLTSYHSCNALCDDADTSCEKSQQQKKTFLTDPSLRRIQSGWGEEEKILLNSDIRLKIRNPEKRIHYRIWPADNAACRE